MKRNAIPKDPRGGHVRLYWAILDCPAWRVLTHADVRVYLALRRKLGKTNNGDINATLAEMRHAGIPVMANGQRLSTNNARRERLAIAPTYRDAWRRGQRCIIPAESFDEPYWGTGKNIWWRFWRADNEPWALAGIWSEWTDPQTGEVLPSYSMITQNCDGHPLLGLMHKPDPKLPADKQDKRAVVSLERENWDQWLNGSLEDAAELIQVPPVELFRHGAADPAKQVALV